MASAGSSAGGRGRGGDDDEEWLPDKGSPRKQGVRRRASSRRTGAPTHVGAGAHPGARASNARQRADKRKVGDEDGDCGCASHDEVVRLRAEVARLQRQHDLARQEGERTGLANKELALRIQTANEVFECIVCRSWGCFTVCGRHWMCGVCALRLTVAECCDGWHDGGICGACRKTGPFMDMRHAARGAAVALNIKRHCEACDEDVPWGDVRDHFALTDCTGCCFKIPACTIKNKTHDCLAFLQVRPRGCCCCCCGCCYGCCCCCFAWRVERASALTRALFACVAGRAHAHARARTRTRTRTRLLATVQVRRHRRVAARHEVGRGRRRHGLHDRRDGGLPGRRHVRPVLHGRAAGAL